jgi:hypothetical protein
MAVTLLERLDERWERMDGAAARKIDRILKERRDAAAEIRRLREALTDVTGVGGDPAIMIRVAADALRK